MSNQSIEKTAVILPTYNESENIIRLIEEIQNLGIPSVIIVVDDNSPDGTSEIVRREKGSDSGVELLRREKKMGLGTAYLAGFRKALEDEYVKLFLTMDADFSHHPRFIPSILEAARDADIVIGSRYIPGGETKKFAWNRRLISRTANLFAKSLLKLSPSDCTAGFRVYRRRVLETIPFDSIQSIGYSFLVEFLYRCEQRKFNVSEVPITYTARSHGLSKISMDEIIHTATTIIRLAFKP